MAMKHACSIMFNHILTYYIQPIYRHPSIRTGDWFWDPLTHTTTQGCSSSLCKMAEYLHVICIFLYTLNRLQITYNT